MTRELLDRPQSPLEELFLQGAQKYAHPGFHVRSQLPVDTPQGAFRVDVALLPPSHRVRGVRQMPHARDRNV